jgi:hypothetical protein
VANHRRASTKVATSTARGGREFLVEMDRWNASHSKRLQISLFFGGCVNFKVSGDVAL